MAVSPGEAADGGGHDQPGGRAGWLGGRGGGPGRGSSLDRRAVARGGGAYLAIAIPCGLLIALLHGKDAVGQESSLWVVAAIAVIIVAPVVGGAVAGAAQPRAPLSNGAAAIGLPAGIYLVVRVAAGIVRGTLTINQVVSFVLYLVVFTGLGVVGSYLAYRRRIGSG
ncbi:MAG TPA: hypothetical protein VKQ71_15945 [Acidimicrobiales bacterium]|nr:hypothetical protein [Acidimicrobiales bacterium]